MEIRLFVADDEMKLIDSITNTISDVFETDLMEYDTNPNSSLVKIREFKPDIVITDINFSSGNDPSESDKLSTAGVELARQIRKEFPLVKIIASSGYRNNDIVFSKITDKDWYDKFYTKGDKNLLEIYSKVREEVIVYKTGLIPKLCKFFAPTNYGWDIDKSIYRLLHSNFKREDNLKCIEKIENFFNSFAEQLCIENKELLNNMLRLYKDRNYDEREKIKIKSEFYIVFEEFSYLKNPSANECYFGEMIILKYVWDKIISETRDHSNIEYSNIYMYDDDFCIRLIVEQKENFSYADFLKGRTINEYKRIKNYGTIVISSGTKKLDVLTEKVEDSREYVKGTRIEMILKKIPTVKQAGNKR